MNRWLRVFAPAVALALVLAAAFSALDGGRASAGQSRVAGQPAVAHVAALVAAQAARPAAVAPQPAAAVAAQLAVPAEEPKTGPDADNIEQDGPQSGAQDEAQDGAETSDNEAADAAALASKAKITADQAKAAALVANPGATAVKVELGDENGMIVYSVELSTGADVKVDAQSGKIVGTDQPDSDRQDSAE